ncbi:MAG: NusG domain II-containing protein [Rhodocyclaceae bacterium]|nr:NusG domain II-containing protein [Rhodocyclaceae bacterium]
MDLAALSAWRRHLLAGDLLVIGAGLAATVASFLLLWQGDRPERAIVRAGGAIVAELPLDAPRSLTVAGPLGETRIEVEPGRARVAADPGPRQYCVRQGWLSRGGAVAICAPNQVSLALDGGGNSHDSLSY